MWDFQDILQRARVLPQLRLYGLHVSKVRFGSS